MIRYSTFYFNDQKRKAVVVEIFQVLYSQVFSIRYCLLKSSHYFIHTQWDLNRFLSTHLIYKNRTIVNSTYTKCLVWLSLTTSDNSDEFISHAKKCKGLIMRTQVKFHFWVADNKIIPMVSDCIHFSFFFYWRNVYSIVCYWYCHIHSNKPLRRKI